MRSRATLFVSAFACLLLAGVVQAQTMQAPKPGPEVKKMGVFVGHFNSDGEAKPGVMGPNAMKMSGTEDCRWTAGGFGLLCTGTSDMGGMKGTVTALMYYDPSDKMYHYHEVDSGGDVGESTGTFDGDTWTWNGKGFMGGKTMYSKYVMKGVSRNGYEWTMGAGDSEPSIQEGMTGKVTRAAAAAKPMESKPQ
ncbi:MAG TPA: DUF1579 family protein [Candidatus Limnocylindrales bacterium]|nr:DUF1579 family protein [Candidatus Limnocylindrales bacterium]